MLKKNNFRYTLAIALTIGLMLGSLYKAQAFIDTCDKGRLSILSKGIAPVPIRLKRKETISKGLIRSKDNSEKEWIGLWNPWGTIHRLTVKEPYPPQRLRTLYKDTNEMTKKAEVLIREYPELFKVSPEDLVLKESILRGSIIYCSFGQVYKGVKVYGGGGQFRFDRNGNLLMVAGDTYPDIDLDPSPVFTQDEAIDIVQKYRGITYKEDDIGQVELYILPVPYKEGLEYILVWQVPVFGASPSGSRLIFVNAHTGEPVLSYRLDRKAVHGKVGGLVLPEYYNDVPEWTPFANQQVYLLNQSTPIGEYNLDEDPGWKRDGMWELGVPEPLDINSYGHAGCPDPDTGITGQNVFGYNLRGDYTNLMKPRYLTTDTIYCLNKTGVALTFWRWLGVQREYWENDLGYRTDYDRATVEASNDGGLTWTVIWSNGTSQIEDGVYDSFLGGWKGWNLQFFDISDLADGKDLVIRWGMGATDGSGTFCGWNIDDIGFFESLNSITDPNGYFEFPNTDDVPLNALLIQLKGPYVEVINEDGAPAINNIKHIEGNSETPINMDWHTNLSTLKDFDEFNVFYHINLLQDYIKALDPFYDAMDKKGPIKVIVRYGDNYKNAFWSPENKICFGEGDSCTDGYRNFAHFSDIIYHEYSHALTDSFYSFFMPPLTSIRKTTDGEQTGPVFVTEFDAMHEAFSDYWACTINDDPLIGDGDFWIRHRYVRSLDNKFKYPDDYGDDAYANSLIVSGAMWETRELLGRELADTLFHFARYGGSTTFTDFLIDVLLQDEITFDGEHVTLLKDIFGARGISRAPSSPGGLVAVAGDTYIDLDWKENKDLDEVHGYYVYFRTENDIASDREDPSVRRDAGLTTNYRLDGLTNGTTYVLKVTAYNVYNAESEESELVYATPFSDSSSAYLGTERRVFCFIESL